MGEKRKAVYHALVAGATKGLSDTALYEFVQDKCPKTSSKRIVRASLLALSDPSLKDKNILDVIYALAIKHRLDELGVHEHDEEDDVTKPVPNLENA